MEIENSDDYKMQIDLLDYAIHRNVDINRESNRNDRLSILKLPFMEQFAGNMKNRNIQYKPSEQDLTLPKISFVNLELVVRYITNLKLNLWLDKGTDDERKMIPES